MNRYKWIISILLVFFVLIVAGCGKSSEGNQTIKDNINNEGELDYPTQSIDLIIPYSAGGSMDSVARPLSNELGNLLGYPVVVVNKPGATGTIGASEVARSNPDGHTLLQGSIGNIVITPFTTDTGYDYEDLKPIARLTTSSLALVVNKDSPIDSIEEFISHSKENKEPIKISTPGATSAQSIYMQKLAIDEGFEVNVMAYEGAAPAYAALENGEVDAWVAVSGEVTGKDVKVLAVTSDERLDFLPDVPTFNELGFDLVSSGGYGILGPKDMSDESVEYLAEVIKQAAENPEVLELWENANIQPGYLGPEDYAKDIKNQVEVVREVLSSLGQLKD